MSVGMLWCVRCGCYRTVDVHDNCRACERAKGGGAMTEMKKVEPAARTDGGEDLAGQRIAAVEFVAGEQAVANARLNERVDAAVRRIAALETANTDLATKPSDPALVRRTDMLALRLDNREAEAKNVWEAITDLTERIKVLEMGVNKSAETDADGAGDLASLRLLRDAVLNCADVFRARAAGVPDPMRAEHELKAAAALYAAVPSDVEKVIALAAAAVDYTDAWRGKNAGVQQEGDDE